MILERDIHICRLYIIGGCGDDLLLKSVTARNVTVIVIITMEYRGRDVEKTSTFLSVTFFFLAHSSLLRPYTVFSAGAFLI